jgi:RHH-type proline utilization regulon transcriptional repressor/proline dehydrogenase/delta 1-pyrroline-5-carboxylate dehydrogenase
VLQAYLPEAHHFFGELVTWAQSRYQESGGTIKVRLVKGANLAMERAEAELHGWALPRIAQRQMLMPLMCD